MYFLFSTFLSNLRKNLSVLIIDDKIVLHRVKREFKKKKSLQEKKTFVNIRGALLHFSDSRFILNLSL